MELSELIKKAKEIREKYKAINQKPWGVTEYVQGFVGDVGDLMKLIMTRNGFRKGDTIDEKLKHELCDCLWSILIISDELSIDLESEFPKQMELLKNRI